MSIWERALWEHAKRVRCTEARKGRLQLKVSCEGGRKEDVRKCVFVCASAFLFALTQLMTDVAGNPEEERRTEFYQAPWLPEAVGRYIYSKVGRQANAWLYSLPSLHTSAPIFMTLILFVVADAAEEARAGAGVGHSTHLKFHSVSTANVKWRHLN